MDSILIMQLVMQYGTAMIVTEAPYNDEESENRINMTENIMNKTETIFSSNSSHLTTSDNNIEVNQVAL